MSEWWADCSATPYGDIEPLKTLLQNIIIANGQEDGEAMLVATSKLQIWIGEQLTRQFGFIPKEGCKIRNVGAEDQEINGALDEIASERVEAFHLIGDLMRIHGL